MTEIPVWAYGISATLAALTLAVHYVAIGIEAFKRLAF